MGRAASVCCGVLSLALVACGHEPAVGSTPASGFVSRQGDVVITRADELEALAGVESIAGTLYVSAAGVRALELPRLRHLGGGLWVDGNDGLGRVALRALTEVGGHLVVSGNGELRSFDVGAAVSIGGSLHIYDNPRLLAVAGLDGLESIGGGFALSGNATLVAVSLTGLRSVGGDVLVSQNRELRHLDAPLLENVGGDLRVLRNPLLPTCAVEALLCQLERGSLAGQAIVVDTDDEARCEATP